MLLMSDLGLPSARPAVSDERRQLLSRRIRWFVAATISYNVVEATIALTEGARVSSTALVGFGLDSVIEVSSAAAVAWQFAGKDPESREKAALRVIAFSFFALAAYVTVDAVRALFGFGEARHSTIGIVLAAVSLAIMPVLSWAQRRAGRELGSLSRLSPIPSKRCCARICPGCFWSDCCSTACSDGPGPTRSPRWSSRELQCGKAWKRGEVEPAAPRR
ncbi:hypothetical protein MARA_04270 [Mycolicibacterium arabiense]|uniref:Cobalt transporter n=1 Tax=Mycolicibacterium arabiense TaxID=1286181 RepID=A0A7I7RSL8_9MYCO|nr:hypothetical protein MARA_04270 [Mycolicibacterium arabiense]